MSPLQILKSMIILKKTVTEKHNTIFFSVPLIINYFHSMKDRIGFKKLSHKQNAICVPPKQRKNCVKSCA